MRFLLEISALCDTSDSLHNSLEKPLFVYEDRRLPIAFERVWATPLTSRCPVISQMLFICSEVSTVGIRGASEFL